MAHIIECIDRSGVRTSTLTHQRLETPLPGDVINWPSGKLGRVDSLHDPAGSWAGPGEVHVCAELGSAFLSWSTKRGRPVISISGGPFLMVKLADLQPTYRTAVVRFWNWGDHLPGAGMGVDYHIARPLFTYVGDSDHYAIRR